MADSNGLNIVSIPYALTVKETLNLLKNLCPLDG